MQWITRVILGEDGQRSLLADLRSGQAGWAVGLGLSLATAAIVLAMGVFCIGIIEMNGRAEERHIAAAFGLGGIAWCASLVWLWSAHRRWARVLRTAFALIAIWVVTIPLCVLAAEVVREEEYFIFAFVFLAIGLSVALVSASIYRNRGGKAIVQRSGEVRVRCPQCGYSMVGLESCTCPECGAGFTIDQLIAAQDYAAVCPDHDRAAGASSAEQAPAHNEHDASDTTTTPPPLSPFARV